uniref:Uncharacterized protein n=1 Tax=Sphaerodactylus townsendi TaxID=933632 RepID=A0ACB8EX41_9SAUR
MAVTLREDPSWKPAADWRRGPLQIITSFLGPGSRPPPPPLSMHSCRASSSPLSPAGASSGPGPARSTDPSAAASPQAMQQPLSSREVASEPAAAAAPPADQDPARPCQIQPLALTWTEESSPERRGPRTSRRPQEPIRDDHAAESCQRWRPPRMVVEREAALSWGGNQPVATHSDWDREYCSSEKW